ncbi:UDP-N-acetylmuramate:L-alanyl-gamma-D-glutamyl-meso-diaminopimelate ligase [Granulosicoccaceae sp. 1_MG-2023]|nr:UDP-N-acetylmuramate:L-alanyl-gamma-D-glutamyl-meso-diaminopimelate ligase [Granulosicoccaceae sp. 1_MG-2023]
MHIHVSAACGTFMGGIARLAAAMGHEVTGSDAGVYPPMSDQLRDAGISLMEGFSADNLRPRPDLVIIGNALSRGNPEVEAVLEQGIPYTSGPQWLGEQVLQDRWVLAVAGTHGKTTTSSLLAWVLEDNGLSPGFLIGGVPGNFGESARLGETPFFVVEADEYDTAFFDKRSKFVHYRPRTAVLNNLEFDHADIFPDLEAIKTQFHHLVRTVPGNGLLVVNGDDANLAQTLTRGCWTPQERFSADGCSDADWRCDAQDPDYGRRFDCVTPDGKRLTVDWPMGGRHSVSNALAVIAAARHVGVPVENSIDSLSRFRGIKRRMEVIARAGGVTVYDDFAHHPTAIETTLRGLRASVGEEKIIAVLEMRSNTMRMGYHREKVLKALKVADLAIIYAPKDSHAESLSSYLNAPEFAGIELQASVDAILTRLSPAMTAGSHVVIMSNGAFEGIHARVAGLL